MPNTLTLIQKITVGATVSSGVTFSNIPQGYSDLKIFGSVRSNVGNPGDFIYLYLNNPGTGAYTQRFLRGDGSSASSGNNSVSYYPLQFINGDGSTANTFGNFEIYIPNYTSSNQKSFSVDIVSENNSTTAYADIQAGLWNQTAAVTGITLNSGSGNFVQHSTFYLYGVTKFGSSTPGSAAAYATGGDTITTDGTYWYHAFRSSGIFTPRKSITCDVLVVAGGAGSSQHQGGGGGAGGLLAHTSQNLSSTNYTVTVGAGGTGVLTSTVGGNGSNSQFSSLTASIGGGAGGSFVAAIQTGANGGSGGGGGGRNTGDSSINAGGTGTVGQGNNGGNGTGSDSDAKQGWRGGGGGGAGSAGGNGLNASQMAGFGSGIIGSGNGGDGTNTYSSWANATSTGVSGYFAGGGAGGGNSGGGTGGLGGGGNGGGTSTSGTSGISNTGAGAGGAGNGTVVANGGSGIIIVRYPV
jgi:hypothetical protein